MRTRSEKERRGWLWRFWSGHAEVAYVFFGLRGLRAQIEFPSDWHEHRRAWVRLGFGLFSINFSFPWPRVVPDHYQCSGPTYGFYFFEDHLVLNYGKDTGNSRDPKASTFIDMPWSWRHQWHQIDGEPQQHPYRYVLHNGKVQERIATIKAESRLWTRYWLPWRRISRYIDIEFNDEVGERSGSWKGGTLGCGYELKPSETPLECLRRMERERKFT